MAEGSGDAGSLVMESGIGSILTPEQRCTLTFAFICAVLLYAVMSLRCDIGWH